MKKTLFASLLLVAPMVASAQSLAPLEVFIGSVGRLVGLAVPILITLALVVFFWGLVRYLWGSSGKQDHDAGKNLMLWGLITLFIMVSVWGIVRIAQVALGVPNVAPTTPGVLLPATGSGARDSGTNNNTYTGY